MLVETPSHTAEVVAEPPKAAPAWLGMVTVTPLEPFTGTMSVVSLAVTGARPL